MSARRILGPVALFVAVTLWLLILGGLIPAIVHAAPPSVEKWRGIAHTKARKQGLNTKAVTLWLAIIDPESGGNEKAGNGYCVGLGQFDRDKRDKLAWIFRNRGHKDWRTCGSCSTEAFMYLYRRNGARALKAWSESKWTRRGWGPTARRLGIR